MNKEKPTFEKVVLMITSGIINNCNIIFNVKKLPPIKIYKSTAEGIIIKEDFK